MGEDVDEDAGEDVGEEAGMDAGVCGSKQSQWPLTTQSLNQTALQG